MTTQPPTFGDGRLAARFWKGASVNDATGCWEWNALCNSDGYGKYYLGRYRGAHRVSFESLVGLIPDGLQLDHLCRVRRCVNPTHLEPVTSRENILRSNGVAALHAIKTHCINGHELTPENIRPNRGGRDCLICNRRRRREYKIRRRLREGGG